MSKKNKQVAEVEAEFGADVEEVLAPVVPDTLKVKALKNVSFGGVVYLKWQVFEISTSNLIVLAGLVKVLCKDDCDDCEDCIEKHKQDSNTSNTKKKNPNCKNC